jgi:hypothetical protein
MGSRFAPQAELSRLCVAVRSNGSAWGYQQPLPVIDPRRSELRAVGTCWNQAKAAARRVIGAAVVLQSSRIESDTLQEKCSVGFSSIERVRYSRHEASSCLSTCSAPALASGGLSTLLVATSETSGEMTGSTAFASARVPVGFLWMLVPGRSFRARACRTRPFRGDRPFVVNWTPDEAPSSVSLGSSGQFSLLKT